MRKQLTKIALVASIVFALAFALSCSNDKDESNGNESNGNESNGNESNGNESNDNIGNGGKPVCSAILYGIGMCFEGGNLTKEDCDAMSTPVPKQWQENGSCPSGGNKCPNSYYGEGTGYAYGNYNCPGGAYNSSSSVSSSSQNAQSSSNIESSSSINSGGSSSSIYIACPCIGTWERTSLFEGTSVTITVTITAEWWAAKYNYGRGDMPYNSGTYTYSGNDGIWTVTDKGASTENVGGIGNASISNDKMTMTVTSFSDPNMNGVYTKKSTASSSSNSSSSSSSYELPPMDYCHYGLYVNGSNPAEICIDISCDYDMQTLCGPSVNDMIKFYITNRAGNSTEILDTDNPNCEMIEGNLQNILCYGGITIANGTVSVNNSKIVNLCGNWNLYATNSDAIPLELKSVMVTRINTVCDEF